MKVYLDNCCFNRPFDDQSSITIRLETEAKLNIQQKIKSKDISLAWSYVLDFENNANPLEERKIEIQKWKGLSSSFTNETSEILSEMNRLTIIGLKPIDALHVASAIELNCDQFITVDKGILKMSHLISKITVINPVNFIINWESSDDS
jgi:predicted nucleic acid-binding protein